VIWGASRAYSPSGSAVADGRESLAHNRGCYTSGMAAVGTCRGWFQHGGDGRAMGYEPSRIMPQSTYCARDYCLHLLRSSDRHDNLTHIPIRGFVIYRLSPHVHRKVNTRKFCA